jgi:hypothetical protein
VSATNEAYVWEHSPYTGATFLIHLALGDIANDSHGNELWAGHQGLALKCRVQRETVTRAIARLVADDFLYEFPDQHSAPGKPVRYRFLTPDQPVVFAWRTRDDRSHDETDRVTTDHSSRDERSRDRVTTDHTELKENSTQPKELLDTSSDSLFEEFFTTFPTARKGSRREVRKAWDKAIRRHPAHHIIAAAQRYRDDPNREDEFTAGGARWLNRDGWEEGPIVASNGKRRGAETPLDRVARELVEEMNGQHPGRNARDDAARQLSG